MGVLAAGSSPADAAFPGGNGKFLYNSDGQLFAYDPAIGSASALGSGYSGRYSADGSKIVFWVFGSGKCDLIVMDSDGSNRNQVTNATGCDYQTPSFSPDGARLSFVRNSSNGSGSSIGVVDANGANEAIIATSPSGGFYGSPVWSPDGQKIAFSGSTEYHGNSDVYTINPDGTGLSNLTAVPEGTHTYNQPDWAPDGSQLVFTQGSAGQEGWASPGVYLVNADGSNVHPILLTSGCGAASSAVWSPNGDQIGYSFRQGNCGPGALSVFTMNTDGSNRVIAHGGASDKFLQDWQPSPAGGPVSVAPAPPPASTLRQIYGFDVAADGTLAFVGVRSDDPDYGQPDVFVSVSPGSPVRITYDALSESGPSISNDHRVAYSPGGQAIVLRNGDGSGRVQLAPTSYSCGYAAPGIAPDGSFVVYSNHCGGTKRVGTDGSNEITLSNELIFFGAEVAADGTRIAGQCYNTATFASGICTINSDGSNPRLIENSSSASWIDATWSPDGTRLASIKYDNANISPPELHVFKSDGSDDELVPTPGANFKSSPRWLPDGRIGYIYATEVDGSTSELRFAAPPVLPDQDGDGVANEIDTGSGTWNDGSGTTGSIGATDPGVTVTVVDAAAPDGVQITVSGSSGRATFSICGFTVRLGVGSSGVFSCGSIRIEMNSGQAEVILVGGTSVVTIPAPVEAKVTNTGGGSYTVENLGGGNVNVNVNGTTGSIAPGPPITVGSWRFVGFTQPVDNNGVLNKAKAGQAIPIKWRLLGSSGLPVTNLGSATITAKSLNCSLGTTVDQIEETVAGSSGLQNLGNGYYQLNWKSPSTYSNSCKTMQLDLKDGVTHDALFQFTK